MPEQPQPIDSRTIQLPEGEYARYLAIQAAASADEQVRRREARWHALLTGLFGIVAFFGYWNFQGQRAEFEKSIEALEKRLSKDIETAARTELPRLMREYMREGGKEFVAEQLSSARGELDAQNAYFQFVLLARKMDEATSFSDRERDTAISLLERAIASPKLGESEDLLYWVEKMIDALSSARNIEVLEKLDRQFRPLLSKREGIVFTMLEHYSHVILGEAEVLPDTVERWRHYLTMARQHKIRTLSTVFPPAYAFQQAGLQRNPVTDELMRDITDLTARQKGDVLRRIEQYVVGHGDKGAFKRPLAYVLRIQRVFKAFSDAYKVELAEVAKTAERR